MTKVRTLTERTILPMPLLTKAMHHEAVYVICPKSLRAAVLSGAKLITLGSALDLAEARKYVAEVLDKIKMR